MDQSCSSPSSSNLSNSSSISLKIAQELKDKGSSHLRQTSMSALVAEAVAVVAEANSNTSSISDINSALTLPINICSDDASLNTIDDNDISGGSLREHVSIPSVDTERPLSVKSEELSMECLEEFLSENDMGISEPTVSVSLDTILNNSTTNRDIVPNLTSLVNMVPVIHDADIQVLLPIRETSHDDEFTMEPLVNATTSIILDPINSQPSTSQFPADNSINQMLPTCPIPIQVVRPQPTENISINTIINRVIMSSCNKKIESDKNTTNLPQASLQASTMSFESSNSIFENIPASTALQNASKKSSRIKRKSKNPIPDDNKTDKYWHRRMKNNIAARRSREARKEKENQVCMRATLLEEAHAILRDDIAKCRALNKELRHRLSQYESVDDIKFKP